MNIIRQKALDMVDSSIERKNKKPHTQKKFKQPKPVKTHNPFKSQSGGTAQNVITAVVLGIVLIYYCAKGNYGVEYYDQEMAPLYRFMDGLSGEAGKVYFGGAFIQQLLWVLGGYALMIFYFVMDRINNRHYADYEQQGTAKFMTPKFVKDFNMVYNYPLGQKYSKSDYEKGEVNQIYSQHCQIALNTRITGFNLNAICVGGPGTGKSFRVVLPNLCSAYDSFVITDPSSELLKKTGNYLEENGYTIKVLNLIDMVHSNTYNPFNYLRNEQDVLTLIQSFINATNDGVKASSDPFWEKAEMALLQALVFYVTIYQSKQFQNFATIANMLRRAKADPKQTETSLDKLFNEIRSYDKDDICVKQYDIFKQASDKTAQSILITTSVRLSMFNINAVKNLTSTDQMELELTGDRKTAIFIVVPSGDNAYKALVNLMYTQLFDTLYYHGQVECNDGALPHHVRLVLDEFANIGVIPGFQNKLTTCRKYNIEALIFVQAESQIKMLYKDDYETIIGACSTYIYLGGNELSTMENLSKRIGETTIRVRDHSYSHGSRNSSSTSFKYTKRMLMTVDEIRRLAPDECLVLIQGQYAFYDKKYDTPRDERFQKSCELGPYVFEYCNTRTEDIKVLERKRKRIAALVQQRSSKKKAPNERAIQMSPVQNRDIPTDEQSQALLQKHVENRTVVPQIDEANFLAHGATVTQHRSDGTKTEKNALKSKPKNNFEMKGYTDKHNIQTFTSTSGTESLMESLDNIII